MNTKFIAVLATAGIFTIAFTGEISGRQALFITAIIWIGWFFSRKSK